MARRSATAAPMPPEAQVTMATRLIGVVMILLPWVGRRRSALAAILGDRCREGIGGAVGGTAIAAHDAAGQSDPGWRGLLPALREPDRGHGGCGGRLRRRQAFGTGSCRHSRHSGALFPATGPAALPAAISRHPAALQRSAPAARHDPRRLRLHPNITVAVLL